MEQGIQQHENLRYFEAGNDKGEVLLLLHGLFGSMSNFEQLINHFKKDFKVAVPILPIYEIDPRKTSLEVYVNYVQQFVDLKQYEKVHLLGNSLGGHIGLLFTLKSPDLVASLTLTGSSGLFEDSLGGTYPRRGSYEFVEEKARATFYDPNTVTKEVVDEVYAIVNDRKKVLNLIATAKSALRYNMEDRLSEIKAPTLLVWGKQDNITPPFVAEKFKEGIPHAELVFIDKCGHAPMMERPEEFNTALGKFLQNMLVEA